MASAGTAKPQGKGKELKTTQEDTVEPEQPPIKPRAKDESSSLSTDSHARRTSRKKKHGQTRRKSRHGEWAPGCYTYWLYSLRGTVKASIRLHEVHFWLSLPTSRLPQFPLWKVWSINYMGVHTKVT